MNSCLRKYHNRDFIIQCTKYFTVHRIDGYSPYGHTLNILYNIKHSKTEEQM